MLNRLVRTKRICGDRLRASSLSLSGAKLATKVNIGPRTRVDYPWRVSIGTRATLESDVWLKVVDQNATIAIGDYTFVGRGTELDIAKEIVIGSNVLIAPRVFITDHSHNIDDGQPIQSQGCTTQSIMIGDDVWIGTGAVIVLGVSIGPGAVIGAGAIVNRNVPANEVWAGVPARKIRTR